VHLLPPVELEDLHAALLAELDPAHPRNRYARWWHPERPWTAELLVQAAKAVAKAVDRPLTLVRFVELTQIHRCHVYRCLEGGWTELVDRAGIEPALRGRRIWTAERLLEEFDRVAHRVERIPTLCEFRALAGCDWKTLVETLGPKPAIVARYTAWLAEHGLDSPVRAHPTPARYPSETVVKGKWTRERLIAAARTADRASPDPLTRPLFCELAEVSDYTIYRLFPRGWFELVTTARIRPAPTARRWTDDALLTAYHALHAKLGRHPTANELRRHADVSHNTYRKRFGGVRELRERYAEWLRDSG
jgi:hypothetical protein